MIDLPLGMAIVAVKSDIDCNFECINEDYKCSIDCCKGCIMQEGELEGFPETETCGCFGCTPDNRRDGKNAIFKLVEYPEFIFEIDELIKENDELIKSNMKEKEVDFG